MSSAAAKRPSLVKKQTRKGREQQDAALDMGAKFTIDGEEFQVTMGDLTALDIAALRKQTGKSFAGLLAELFSDDADIDTIAAVLWLARKVNGGESSLTYEQVASETDYDIINKIKQGSEETSDDDAPAGKDVNSLDPEG